MGILQVGQGGTYATIQAAVDAAVDGDTIRIAAGTYREQVLIEGKRIEVLADNGAILEMPDNAAITSSGGYFAALTVKNAVATIYNLDVVGRGQGGGFETQTFAGVAFIDSDGYFVGGSVSGFRQATLGGQQHGYGVLVRSTAGAEHSVEIGGNRIFDNQKNAIDARGAGLKVNIQDNAVTGAGLTEVIAQNGIVLVNGVDGVVSGNIVSALGFSGAGTSAAGILLFGANGVRVSDNSVTMAGSNAGTTAIALTNSDAGEIVDNLLLNANVGIEQTGTFAVPVSSAGENGFIGVTTSFDFTADPNSTTPITIDGSGTADTITTGGGNDTIESGGGNDAVDSGAGNDTIVGGDGEGDDYYNGNTGNDTVTYTSQTGDLTVDLREVDRSTDATLSAGVRVRIGAILNANGQPTTTPVGYAVGGMIDVDVLRGFENITSGAGNDTLYGNALANTILGGDGNDAISGGAGADILDGGNGIDTLIYGDITNGVQVNLMTGTVNAGAQGGSDTVSNFENAVLGTGADQFIGSAADNVVEGGSGNDIIDGGAGNDTAVYRGVQATDGTALQSFEQLILAAGGTLGTDRLTDVERVRFINGSDVFDVTVVDGNALVASRADVNGVAQVATLTVAAQGVLANDVNLDQGASDIKVVSAVSFGETAGTVGTALIGTYGALTLNADGSYTYVANAGTRALPAGNTVSDVFTYRADDGDVGTSASTTLTITVTGTNDVPVITGTATGNVVEETANGDDLTTSGALVATDADTGESSFAPQTGASGAYGTFTLSATGEWTYAAENSQRLIQQLGAGDTITDSFTAFSSDGSASQTVTVTITGVNDGVMLIGGTLATFTDTSETDDFDTVAGQVDNTPDADFMPARATMVPVRIAGTLVDADVGDIYTYSVSGTPDTTYGVFDLQSDGSYTFTPDDAAINALKEDTSVSYTIVVTDNAGSSDTTDFSVRLRGTEDTAVITGTLTGSVQEDVAVVGDDSLVATGTVVVSDADTGDSFAVEDLNQEGDYGIFSITSAGEWTYTANNDQRDIQQLGLGESLTDSFVVTSLDGTASETVTVTINGSNDGPILIGDSLGSLTDTSADDEFDVIGGRIDNTASRPTVAVDINAPVVVGNLIDVDQIGTYTFARAGSPEENETNDAYGTLSVNPDGSYTFVPNDAAINALSATTTLTYTIQVDDGSGAANATTTAEFTLTLNGVDDAPTTGGDITADVVEDTDVTAGNLVANGVLTVVDRDAGQSTYQAQTTDGTYGTFDLQTDGTYTYTASNSQVDVQQLGEGQTITDTFTAVSFDGTEQDVTVTITGTNDAPVVLASTNSYAVTESDAAIALSGTVIVSDDVGDVDGFVVGSTTVTGSGGVVLTSAQQTAITNGFSVNGTTGAYTFNLDSPDYLDPGQTITAVFNVVVTDQLGATTTAPITVTIAGTLETGPVGTNGDDLQTGSGFGDTIDGGNGDDTIRGLSGNDTLFGRAGDDNLDGGSGNDTLIGDTGNDTLSGGSGDDTLSAGVGSNIVDGGSGTDTAVLEGTYNAYTITPTSSTTSTFARTGGNEIDSFANVERYRFSDGVVLQLGSGGADTFELFGKTGPVTLNTGAADDSIFVGTGFGAADAVDAGAGFDAIGLFGTTGIVLGSNFVNTEFLGILSGADTRFGDGTARFAYTLATTDVFAAPGIIYAVQASSLVAGESLVFDASAETDSQYLIYGGAGTDTLIGGSLSDAFFFGEGRFNAGDSVNGGAGVDDQFTLRGDYSAPLSLGGSALVGIETMVLQSGSDTRFGPAGPDYSYNITVDDGTVAAGGNLRVTATGLRTTETLVFDGSAETDGSFLLAGGAGADTLKGGALADQIFGRGGADVLTGGGGNDSFVYQLATDSTTTAQDRILDFAIGDKINLVRVDANTVAGAAVDKFVFVGDAAFSGAAGELRAYESTPGQWFVEGDTNGDGLADLSISVTTTHTLTVVDFVL